MKPVRAKPHRLPRDRYQGLVSVTFTGCLEEPVPFFTAQATVNVFVDHLRHATSECLVDAIYCFMPEHMHTVVLGTSASSDTLRAMELFKHQTGWWLKTNSPAVCWQKSFWDRVIRSTYELASQARYVVNNPVRRGLVKDWREYQFTGAIGLDLEEFLTDLSPF
jgi:REP element-mobilizing transposase RayT